MSETRCSSCHMTTVMEWVSKQFRKYWCLGAASVEKPIVSNLPKMMLDHFHLDGPTVSSKNYHLGKFEVFMEFSDDVFFLSKAGSFSLGVHRA